MIDGVTASAIIVIASMIYDDYELGKLTQEEYFRINNMDEIIHRYTNKHVDMIHAELNSYFDY